MTKHLSMRLALALVLLAPLGVLADTPTKCPLIRPAGLPAAEVDRIVLADYAHLLQRAPDRIDVTLTPRKLDGSDNTQLFLMFTALAIRDDLGIDVLAGLARLAAERHGKLEDVVTVAEIQAEARRQYAAGKDSPSPDAAAGASYKLQDIQVSTPRPVAGWRLVQCGSDKVTFAHPSALPGQGIMATARLSRLPAWHDAQTFRADARQALASMAPTDMQVTSSRVDLVQRPGRPCADFDLVGKRAGVPFEIRGRACYAFDNDNPLGYMTMVSFTGSAPPRHAGSRAGARVHRQRVAAVTPAPRASMATPARSRKAKSPHLATRAFNARTAFS